MNMLVAVLALCAVGGVMAGDETTTVTSWKEYKFHVVQVFHEIEGDNEFDNEANAIGDVFVPGGEIRDDAGRVIGSTDGLCTYTSVREVPCDDKKRAALGCETRDIGNEFSCTWTIKTARGTLVLYGTGFHHQTGNSVTAVVLGGTGRYLGAVGHAVIQQLPFDNVYRYTYEVEVKVPNF